MPESIETTSGSVKGSAAIPLAGVSGTRAGLMYRWSTTKTPEDRQSQQHLTAPLHVRQHRSNIRCTASSGMLIDRLFRAGACRGPSWAGTRANGVQK